MASGADVPAPGPEQRLFWAAMTITVVLDLITKAVAEATNGKPDVAVYASPVTAAGRVEMLPFLHEQAVSITAHRFGTPNPLSDELI